MLPCNICNKIYKSVPALREHFKTKTHKDNVVKSKVTCFQNDYIECNNTIPKCLPDTPSTVSSHKMKASTPSEQSPECTPGASLELQVNDTIYSRLLDNSNKGDIATNVSDTTIDSKTNTVNTGSLSQSLGTDSICNLDNILHDIPQNNNTISDEPTDVTCKTSSNSTSLEPIVYRCIACRKEYSHKNNLYRHYKTCTIYTEAKTLNKTTTTIMENAIHLIKQKYFKKIIPAIISNINNTDSQTQYKSVSNNQIEQTITNNITINNNNITIGTWKTINYVRPFLHENLDVLDDEKNIEAIVASGYNAVNTLIDIVYSQPENNNIQIINRRKNFVRTIDANGEIIIIRFNEACEKLAYKFLNKTDELMDKNSAKIIAKNPGLATGVRVYEQSNNWFGESGNDRYPEYESHIGMKIENISRKSDINLIRFQNETKKLLLSGGTLNFNKDSL